VFDHKEVPVKMLTSFFMSFLIALATVISLMLVFTIFDAHAFRPAVAVGIAIGIGLANAYRVSREFSVNTFALLVGALVGVGTIFGSWFSNG
jgi:hypothetical protein